MPRSSSSTDTALRGSMNMREPSAFHARSDTFTICDGTIVFARSAPNTRYAVISLVSDAGSRRSSALAAASVCPLVTSTSVHAGGGDRRGGNGGGQRRRSDGGGRRRQARTASARRRPSRRRAVRPSRAPRCARESGVAAWDSDQNVGLYGAARRPLPSGGGAPPRSGPEPGRRRRIRAASAGSIARDPYRGPAPISRSRLPGRDRRDTRRSRPTCGRRSRRSRGCAP